MIQIPLSLAGSPDEFAKAVEAHRVALVRHMMGKPGKAMPAHNTLVESVIARQPQDGPVADRGPDKFVILTYEIYDDTPASPEVQLLRDSINQS